MGANPVAGFYSRLLGLLDQGAAPSAFDALSAEIRAICPDGEGRIEADLALAIRLRESVEHKLKRERELIALNETARDLSAMRDTDQVLQAIIRRARQLVGSDIAYLSAAPDERSPFHVRATEGVVSEAFASIVVPRDVGICGSVARTRRPWQSGQYKSDRSFHHDPEIDTAILAEGVISILGIPLELEAQIIGVLFVADRYERSYNPQEISILQSLGTFAALAIENARLLEEAQRALTMAREANVALRAKADDIESAAIAHERLTELIARGGSLEDLRQRVATLLGGEAVILDERQMVIAGTLPPGIPDHGFASAIRESARLGRSVPFDVAPFQTFTVAAVTSGAVRLGALVFSRSRPMSSAEIRTLERAAIVTGIVLLSMERVAEATYRNVADIVSALLRGTSDPFRPEGASALPVGVSLSWPATILLVSCKDGFAAHLPQVVRAAASGRQTIGAAFNGDLAVVTSGDDWMGLARRIAAALEDSGRQPFNIVASQPVSNVAAAAAEYRSLRRSLALLRNLGQSGRVVPEKTLSLYGLLFDGQGEEAAHGFIEHTIGPLLDHDRRRKSQLAGTLYTYFETGRSLQRAADMLGIHVNTMRQRLDSISALCPDWAETERGLELHMALRLHRLSETLPA
ncbi:helix-turn-helix domain-containing protein [Phreatobacter sp.]|uniref:helix-turn-helix domain-containing protein n=1 Tax=Phreatobacter sp. TaxID=1966341 RepID=UPI003F7085D0